MGIVLLCVVIGIAMITGISTWIIIHNSRHKVKPNSAIVRLGFGGTQVFLKPGKWVHCVPYLHNCQTFTFRPQELEVELSPPNFGITADEYRVSGRISMAMNTMRTADAILDACTSSTDGNPWSESAIDMIKSQLTVFLKDHINSHSLKDLQSGEANEDHLRARLTRAAEHRGGVIETLAITGVQELGESNIQIEEKSDSILGATDRIRRIKENVLKDKEAHKNGLANLTNSNESVGQQRIAENKRETDQRISEMEQVKRRNESVVDDFQQQTISQINRAHDGITTQLNGDQDVSSQEIGDTKNTADPDYWKRKGFKDREDYLAQKAEHRSKIEQDIAGQKSNENDDSTQLDNTVNTINKAVEAELDQNRERTDKQIDAFAIQEKQQKQKIRTDEEHALDELQTKQQKIADEGSAASASNEKNKK